MLTLRLYKERVRLADCGTFQPSFGTRDFKSIFRTVPGNSGLVVVIGGCRGSRLSLSRQEHNKDLTAVIASFVSRMCVIKYDEGYSFMGRDCAY